LRGSIEAVAINKRLGGAGLLDPQKERKIAPPLRERFEKMRTEGGQEKRKEDRKLENRAGRLESKYKSGGKEKKKRAVRLLGFMTENDAQAVYKEERGVSTGGAGHLEGEKAN